MPSATYRCQCARARIVGLGGLLGAGRSEVAEAVFGLREARGTVRIDGVPFEERTPQAAMARGIAFVSEDRRYNRPFSSARFERT